MESNVLDFSIQHFGLAAEEDLYSVLRSANRATMVAYLAAYRVFAGNERMLLPPLPEDQLRPLSQWTLSMPPTMVESVYLNFDTLNEEGAEWRVTDAIKYRLLYCHSLALDDPLGHLILMTINQMDGNDREFGNGHEALLRYVNILLHFKCLIRTHVICLVPLHNFSSDLECRLRNRRALYEALLQCGDYDPTEFVALIPPDGGMSVDFVLEMDVAKDLTCYRLAADLESLIRSPGRMSLYLKFKADAEFLRLGTHISKEEVENHSEFDSWLLRQLIHMDLPGMSKLEPNVLLDIRAGDEFNEWRRTLSKALVSTKQLPSGAMSQREIRRRVNDELKEGRAALESRFKKSRLLAGLTKGSTSMIVGVASTVAIGAVDPSKIGAASLFGVLMSSIAAGAIDAFQSSQPTAGSRALATHYVAALQTAA